MGFKGVADSSPAYSTMAWIIHFCKDWLKILEANKKTDRDPQRLVLEIIWIKGDGSCEHVCINESACWGNHAQLGINLFTSLGVFSEELDVFWGLERFSARCVIGFMKPITRDLDLHESPCLSVQSKLFEFTGIVVDYLWRIILWKPWHDNVEDHHLWTLAAKEEEVIWTKSKRTAEFFGNLPSHIQYMYKVQRLHDTRVGILRNNKMGQRIDIVIELGQIYFIDKLVVVPTENFIPWRF